MSRFAGGPGRRSVAPVAVLCLALTACANDGAAAGRSGGTPGSTAADAAEHGAAEQAAQGADHARHIMNEPDATPADELADADVRTGDFALLGPASPGHRAAAGTVWVAESIDGTTVTVRMRGLESRTDYLFRLHDRRCTAGDGGDRFRFDREGPGEPPNEVHLAFTSSEDGTGTATVTNHRLVGGAATSIVMHPVATVEHRLACADF